MNSISIGERLWFEETLLGATLNYRSSENPGSVLFRVGISYQSLRDCNAALGKDACLWTIRDGSLSIYGDPEELTLTFCSVEGEFLETGVSLHGRELALFRYAVDTLSSKQKALLN